MKTVTINASEPVNRAFQQFAKQHDRTTSELVREAMEAYRERVMRPRQSIRQAPPLSLGSVLRPLGAEDDLLAEMRDAAGH
jgi:hypothetical protein